MGTHDDDAIRAEAARLTRAAMSRRGFLGRARTVLAGAAIAPAVLAACGSSGGSKSSGGGGGGGGSKAVTISNWPEYIAKQSKTDFTKDTGIALTYHEDINDNNEYFAKIRPNMSRNQSIGTDGFVLTDWMANRVINQVKWTQPLVASAFPNKTNLRAALAHPPFDPSGRRRCRGRAACPGSPTTPRARAGRTSRPSPTSSPSAGPRRCSP